MQSQDTHKGEVGLGRSKKVSDAVANEDTLEVDGLAASLVQDSIVVVHGAGKDGEVTTLGSATSLTMSILYNAHPVALTP